MKTKYYGEDEYDGDDNDEEQEETSDEYDDEGEEVDEQYEEDGQYKTIRSIRWR